MALKSPLVIDAGSIREISSDESIPTASSVVFHALNDTLFTLSKNSVVYVSGAIGDNIKIALASANLNNDPNKTFGILLNELNPNEVSQVLINGLLENVNTADANIGDSVWLSLSEGAIVFQSPPANANKIFIGNVLVSNAISGIISVNIQPFMSQVGSGTAELPIASTTVLGGVKVDGTTVVISNGVISSVPESLPTASTTTLGGVKVDGTTITVNNGIISSSAAQVQIVEYTKQLNFVGPIQTETGTLRWYPDTDILITNVFLVAGTAPTIGSLGMNILKNGSVIDVITLPLNINKTTNKTLSISLTPNDYITVDVTLSSYAADASLIFTYERV